MNRSALNRGAQQELRPTSNAYNKESDQLIVYANISLGMELLPDTMRILTELGINRIPTLH